MIGKSFNTRILFLFAAFYCMVIQPSMGVNKSIDLNGIWYFKIDPNNSGVKDKWYSENLDIADWDKLLVPGNWDIENRYSDYAGKAWYTRTIFLDRSISEKMTRIVFQSVYNNSIIWINGKKVGENHLGFLSFYFNIDHYIKYGEENRITVLVDNTFKRGAMWNWGGIRRPVTIEITDKSRLEYIHITPDVDLNKKSANIDITFEVSNNSETTEVLQYKMIVLDSNDSIVHEKSSSFDIEKGENKQINTSFLISKSQLRLWHFNSPHLYTCKIELLKGDEVIHQLGDRFGIRKVEIKGESFFLNGEPIKTVGFNLVPEDRMTGSTLPLWRIMEDVDLMKSMGANMARLSHQPLPKDFLDYLDEKGIMIFEEVALWGKDEMVDPEHPIPKEWLERMIKERYNHPSIIGWSVGNEIGYPSMNPKVKEYVASAVKHSKKLDSTRLAVYVSNSAHINKDDAVVYSDMIMLNRYKNWGEDAIKTNINYPNKPIFYSEYGYQITSEDPNFGCINVSEMMGQMRNKSYIIGASYWTFNDYRSAYSGTPVSGNRSWGIVTNTRQKKRAYFAFRKEYAPIKAMTIDKSLKLISIISRQKNDIPAYILDGCKIVWEAYDKKGELTDGGFSNMKTIYPDGQIINVPVKWKSDLKDMSYIKVSLLDGLNYSVSDTTVYLTRPDKPEIISVHSDLKSARVIFKKSSLATSWKVRYNIGDSLQETEETINDFIELSDLKYNGVYDMELIAINNSGESEPNVFTISTKSNEKPPIIWSISIDNQSCFLNFSSTINDYVYQVQYRDKSSTYNENEYVQFSNRGMIKIDSLKEDTEYYLRMRRLLEWGFASDWTHEVRIKTTLVDKPEAPSPIGVIDGIGGTILVFNPPHKTDGYEVSVADKKTNKIEKINVRGSRLNYIYLKKRYPRNRFSISIASTLDGAKSELIKFKE